jgi:hypothetical protein
MCDVFIRKKASLSAFHPKVSRKLVRSLEHVYDTQVLGASLIRNPERLKVCKSVTTTSNHSLHSITDDSKYS